METTKVLMCVLHKVCRICTGPRFDINFLGIARNKTDKIASKPNSHLRSTRCIFESNCSIELIFSKKLLHILMINLFAGSLLQLKLPRSLFRSEAQKTQFFLRIKKKPFNNEQKKFLQALSPPPEIHVQNAKKNFAIR